MTLFLLKNTFKAEIQRTDLLDIIAGAGIIGQGKNPRKAIQAITNGDVYSPPEYSVVALAVRYDFEYSLH